MTGKTIAEGGQGIELPMGTRVLLVEPQKFQADIVRNALLGAGVEVDAITDARDVTKALEALKNGVPDVILTEMEMPDATGEHLAREVRKKGINIPIIAVTSAGENHRVKSALDAGINDDLLKPVSNDQVTRRIARALRNAMLNDMPAPSRSKPARLNSMI